MTVHCINRSAVIFLWAMASSSELVHQTSVLINTGYSCCSQGFAVTCILLHTRAFVSGGCSPQQDREACGLWQHEINCPHRPPGSSFTLHLHAACFQINGVSTCTNKCRALGAKRVSTARYWAARRLEVTVTLTGQCQVRPQPMWCWGTSWSRSLSFSSTFKVAPCGANLWGPGFHCWGSVGSDNKKDRKTGQSETWIKDLASGQLLIDQSSIVYVTVAAKAWCHQRSVRRQHSHVCQRCCADELMPCCS